MPTTFPHSNDISTRQIPLNKYIFNILMELLEFYYIYTFY